MINVAPAELLARIDPDWLDRLPPAQRVVALFDLDLWLRPEQRVPPGDWRSHTTIAGRGWGKTTGYAEEMNRRVRSGECRAPVLMAPNDDRVRDVQVAMLVATSPPWFRAEPYRGGVRWPNGVVALAFTPEAPGRPRSANADLAWLTELVDWKPSTRREAFDNITTATRIPPRPQYFCDTTSKGKNEIVLMLEQQARDDPTTHRIVRGSMFGNPYLTREYLRSEVAKYVKGSRRYDEEILGLVFNEAAGALWQQAWIDEHRRALPPVNPELVIVALDPALSDRSDADETGIIVLARDHAQHVHVTKDLSGRMAPTGDRGIKGWADLVLDECERDAAGVVLERNHLGDHPTHLLRAAAALRGMRVSVLERKAPFPSRYAGTVYVRERVARSSKETRAQAPAALYQAGRVHHVGVLEALEYQLTTWIPGGKSPNRLDAMAYGVAELAGLDLESAESGADAIADAAAMMRAVRGDARGQSHDARTRIGGGRRLGGLR